MEQKQYKIVHQFWHNPHLDISAEIELNELRLLSIKSFISHGYEVKFWSYQKINNLEDIKGAKEMDARKIISEKEFKNHKISLI